MSRREARIDSVGPRTGRGRAGQGSSSGIDGDCSDLVKHLKLTESVRRKNVKRLLLVSPSGNETYRSIGDGYFDPVSGLLRFCDQTKPLTWRKYFHLRSLAEFEKIGEGTYGEIFRSSSGNDLPVILKVMPVGKKGSDGGASTFQGVAHEVEMSLELNRLSDNGVGNRTAPCFLGCKAAFVIKDETPMSLNEAWNKYKKARGSYNEPLSVYPSNQHFLVMESVFGGVDLEIFKFASWSAALSVLVQVTVSLANAELALQFEHRDLHVGNILVDTIDRPFIRFLSGDHVVVVKSYGVFAHIIDFSLSRMCRDRVLMFADLSQEEELFRNNDSLNGHVYAKMRRANGNEWSNFVPRTNVLWLHYLFKYMFYEKRYDGGIPLSRTSFSRVLEELLHCDSACEVLGSEAVLSLFQGHLRAFEIERTPHGSEHLSLSSELRSNGYEQRKR